MKYNPTFHHRRSIRLKGYDYSQAGLYFVTICVQNRGCLFGEIVDGEMVLNNFGEIVHNEWMKTANIRKNVILHEFIVMPNHFHGIIEINNVGAVGALRATPLQTTATPLSTTTPSSPSPSPNIRPYSRTDVKNKNMSSISPKCGELATIVRAFKSAATKRINELCHSQGEKLWQRDYWENIISNELSHKRVVNYIINNPANWNNDGLYSD